MGGKGSRRERMRCIGRKERLGDCVGGEENVCEEVKRAGEG